MVTVRLYVGSLLSDCPTFGCGRTAPEVSDEEGSYNSHFYRWFVESIKNCLLLLVAPPGLIDTLAQLLAWRSLLWLSMTWQWRFLTKSNFLSTTSLTWSLALHLFCFSQEKPLRWKELNTHTVAAKVLFLYWKKLYHILVLWFSGQVGKLCRWKWKMNRISRITIR